MFPAWLRLTLFIIAGVAFLWALSQLTAYAWRRRDVFRRRTGKRTHVQNRDEPLSTVATRQPEPQQPLAVSPTEPPPGLLSILKPGVELPRPPVEKQTAAIASVQERSAASEDVSKDHDLIENSPSGLDKTSSWRPPSWADQPLLNFSDRTNIELPRVLAEDIPATRTDDYYFGPATPILAAFLPESDARFEESRQELQAAGYYEPHSLQNYAAVRYVLMMLGLVIAGVFLILSPPRIEWIAIISLIMLPIFGWAIPRLYVRGKAAERRSEIERGMPDLLDMLNMCVSQGLTIPDALRRILPDLRAPYPALAQELRIVDQQARIGTLPTALENFSRRTNIPEVHSFTSLLTQTDRMGTSISEALISYSDTMRESLKQRAEEKGNRATFRLLFPTVLCLMPAVYLFLMGPAIVELSNFFGRGGRDSLDQGSQVIQEMNANRNAGPGVP